MSTWTSKGLIAGVLSLLLAGCNEGHTPPLKVAALGQGAVMLIAPPGFCIDRHSLGQSFALMARCDTLGSRGALDAPLAVITAATIAVQKSGAIETGKERVLTRQDRDNVTLLQVQGRPPSKEMRDVYWRGIGQVGNQTIGLAIYEAENGAELGELAPQLLIQTMKRTQHQSNAAHVAQLDKSATLAGN